VCCYLFKFLVWIVRIVSCGCNGCIEELCVSLCLSLGLILKLPNLSFSHTLQSTERDSRGVPYGVGSLKESLVNGKRKEASDSTSFVGLQKQLLEAQRKIEEQVSYSQKRDTEVALREAEISRVAAEHKKKIEHLSLVEKFLRETDPWFLNFLETQSADATTNPLSSSPSSSAS